MAGTGAVIMADELRTAYGDLVAADGVSFRVEPEGIFGTLAETIRDQGPTVVLGDLLLWT